MWTKYFNFIKLRRGRVIKPSHGEIDFSRVGTLILHQKGEESTYNIVDGQQRTITFSLLLKVLGADSISFLEQPLANNPHNTRNIPNNFRTLERRANNIIDDRERRALDVAETEKVVKGWEDLPQKDLSLLFSDYLYRVKEWTKGNKAWELTEHNIHKFKGITRKDNFPYAQFFKGAFAFADTVNHSPMPFVSGTRNLKPFQLDTPIVADKSICDGH